ncbi:rod-binding protein [Brevundimonas vitis]|jgi:flagellar protein FlgJ|uniref:Rod-binding protein n=1 Tax=Brevundimonas vitisensis TaxID=2800818 RepID=A0ABX7BLR7_9CAUL|nr:rod-binding protein [Brevundimonas vitisensis]QQQ18530.1 rod-binding protein [Brevundimonas vitisensis]
MTDLTLSPDLLRPTPTPALRQDKMAETAQAFEASFISQMLKPMFEGLSTEAPFGGGEAEATWRSFLLDEMGKQTARAGGIGLADQVMSEMLRLQEVGQ